MNGKVQSPFEKALELCPNDRARLELSRLGANLNLGASSPEWIMVVLYAEARGIFGAATEADRAEVLTQLERIEARITARVHPSTPTAPIFLRDIFVFTVAVFVCATTAVAFGAGSVPWVSVISAFGLGLCGALFYTWIAPRLQHLQRSRHRP